jgi:hypothetical protein
LDRGENRARLMGQGHRGTPPRSPEPTHGQSNGRPGPTAIAAIPEQPPAAPQRAGSSRCPRDRAPGIQDVEVRPAADDANLFDLPEQPQTHLGYSDPSSLRLWLGLDSMIFFTSDGGSI